MAKFLTKSKFSKLIEERVVNKKLTYMEAIIDACDEVNLDPGDVKKFISPEVKAKIEAEAIKLNYLPKSNENTLPI